MEKLNRQDWAVVSSFVGHGLRIGIRANSDQAYSKVLESLPPGFSRSDVPQIDLQYSIIAVDDKPPNGFRRYNIAYANTELIARLADFDTVPAFVEGHLSLHLAEFAKDRVFIHAGVVGWKGKAVVIPGRTQAGKSTLVAALVRAGATYYSDEFALVDRAGRVHPYPSPIKLRNGDGTSRRIHPADLGARAGKKPLSVGLVLVTHHRQGAAWRPRPISPGEGILALLTNTASAQRDPARALSTLGTMVAGARIIKGPRGEADVTVAHLLRAGYLAA